MSPFARLHSSTTSLRDTLSDPPNTRQPRSTTPRGFVGALLIACVLFLAGPAFAADWYASPTGAGTYDCMSAANACAGIPAAINIAAANDIVHVGAGNYTEKVIINKPLTLLGPHAGVHGNDPARATGEAIIKPASGVSISLNADTVIFDGFTVQTDGNSGLLDGTGNAVEVLNTRFVDSMSRGIYVERPLLQPSTDWLIEGNLFDTLVGSSSTAIVMARATNLKILGNVIRNVTYQGVQLSSAVAAEVRGNNISDTDFDGINVAGSENVVIAGNTIASVNRLSGADRGAVRLYDGMTAVSVLCNNIDATNGGVVLRSGTASELNVFHNAIVGGTSVVSNWTAGADIGSNWYGVDAASVGGIEAAGVHVADPLANNPIGDTNCGANAPYSIVAYAGTNNQSTVVDTAFNPLHARLQDILGGAVVGQSIELTANTAAGATATLATSSGNSNYNGELISSAMANSVAGSYTVVATTGALSTTFNLTNTLAPDITLQLNGPVAGVQVDVPAAYIGTLTNNGGALTENAFVKVRVALTGEVLAVGDLTVEVSDGNGNWIEGTLIPVNDGLEVDFPDSSGFPIDAGFAFTHQFRITYHRPGVFNATASVIGVDTQTVYATSAMFTEVVPRSDVVAGIDIDPTSLHAVYDGLSHAATATTTPTGLPVTFSYNGLASAPVDAGQYVVVVSVNAPPYIGSASAILVINKAPSTVTIEPTDLNQSAGMTFPVGAIANPTSTGASIEVTYNGSNTVPTAVGNYTVVATLIDPNYIGSASGILHIGTGDAELLTVNGVSGFTGLAGQLLADPLPSVKATDIGGNPVAGVVVTFAAGTNSGTLSGAVQTTDSNGIATLGGWILDATPGNNTVTATAPSVAGAVIFTANGTAATGALNVTISDGRTYTQVGKALTYTMTVGNAGSSNLSGVLVSNVLPPELDGSAATWQCIPINGATCTNGSGDLLDTINLPAGSSVVYLLNVNVVLGPIDIITNTITVTSSAGAISATDITDVVIFRNGFEMAGDGSQAVGGELGEIDHLGQNTTVGLHLLARELGSLEVITLVSERDGAFRVEAISIDGKVWMRLVARAGNGEQTSTWNHFAGDYAMLMLDGSDLLLLGSETELLIALDRSGAFSLSQPLN